MTVKKPSSAPTSPRGGGPRTALTIEDAGKVGFFGVEVDGTPDDNYTVAGVLAGKPTPETDAKAAAAAKEA